MDEFYAEQDYLEHHGIKGQRWGVRRTPEQLGHYIERTKKKISKNVQLAKAAKASGDVKALNKLNKRTSKLIAKVEEAERELPNAKTKQERRAETAEKVKQSVEAMRARHAENKAAKKEAERQDFLKNATAEELLARKSEFSTEELKNAITRINTETTLKELDNAEKRAWMDKTKKWIDSASNLGKSAVDAFDNYTKIAKAVNRISGEDTLPTFDREGEKQSAVKKHVDKLVKGMDVDAVLKDKSISSKDMEEAVKRIADINKNRASNQSQLNQLKKHLETAKEIDTTQKPVDTSSDEGAKRVSETADKRLGKSKEKAKEPTSADAKETSQKSDDIFSLTGGDSVGAKSLWKTPVSDIFVGGNSKKKSVLSDDYADSYSSGERLVKKLTSSEPGTWGKEGLYTARATDIESKSRKEVAAEQKAKNRAEKAAAKEAKRESITRDVEEKEARAEEQYERFKEVSGRVGDTVDNLGTIAGYKASVAGSNLASKFQKVKTSAIEDTSYYTSAAKAFVSSIAGDISNAANNAISSHKRGR